MRKYNRIYPPHLYIKTDISDLQSNTQDCRKKIRTPSPKKKGSTTFDLLNVWPTHLFCNVWPTERLAYRTVGLLNDWPTHLFCNVWPTRLFCNGWPTNWFPESNPDKKHTIRFLSSSWVRICHSFFVQVGKQKSYGSLKFEENGNIALPLNFKPP
jgi:hypothetical protein